MTSRLATLLVVGLVAVSCEQSTDPVSSVSPDEAEMSVSFDGAEATDYPPSAKPAAGPLVLAANLTQWGTYYHIPNFERLGRQTIPNFLGSIQYIDGNYYSLRPTDAIMKYKGRYYLVPRDARFTRDKYGQFCGGGWGWGSGNDDRSLINDGGLDAACRAHDQAWSYPSASNVRNGDRAFLAALYRVVPKWEYEYDYLRGARNWMECRVRNGVSRDRWTGTCGWTAFWRVSSNTVSRIVR